MKVRNLLEKLSVVKTPQHIEREKIMATIGSVPSNIPMTQGTNDPTHLPPGQVDSTTPAPHGSDSPQNPNPWSDPVVKQNLKAQRAVYAGTLVDFVNQKQKLLDDIAQVEDQLEHVLRVINDLDAKINS